MSNNRTPSPVVGSRPRGRRSVTLDPLTAGGHPDAVVSGPLLMVIGALVITGLVGFLEPVVSLDLFRADVVFSAQVQSLGEIGVSFLALVTAGLGLAYHPRFPTALLGVAAGLCLLLTFEAAQGLFNPRAPGIFQVLAAIVVLTVPYVQFSRRCRLIFHRRVDLSNLRPTDREEDWTVPHMAPVMAPVSAPPVLAAPENKRPRRSRRTAVTPGLSAHGNDTLTAPSAPPADPAGAALWAALYGSTSENHDDHAAVEPAGPAAPTTASGGRRLGLEALINLRPPGS